MTEYAFTLRIHESRLNFVRWLTPGRFQISEPADDSGWLTIKVHMESMELAKMLMFGLGKDGVVIEPLELAQAVIEAAKAIIERDGS